MKKIALAALLLIFSASFCLAKSVTVYVEVNGRRLDPAPSSLKVQGTGVNAYYEKYDVTITGKNPAVFQDKGKHDQIPHSFTCTLPDGKTKKKELPFESQILLTYKDHFTFSFDDLPPSNKAVIHTRVKGTKHDIPVKCIAQLVSERTNKMTVAGKIDSDFEFGGLERDTIYHVETWCMPKKDEKVFSKSFHFNSDYQTNEITLYYEAKPSIIRDLESNYGKPSAPDTRGIKPTTPNLNLPNTQTVPSTTQPKY